MPKRLGRREVLYLCLQFLISVLVFAFCFSLFPDCCVSRIRYQFLFLLRLDGSNRFFGHLQQDCLGTFSEIFWGDLILCSLLCRKPVGHLCCKLYCFLEFLEIQRRNAVLFLSFSQPDFQRRHEQLTICVAVCSRVRATVHQACFPSLRN